jgi:hypothetical protein|eukprot:COSAG02_NODE_86_length_39084_cov_17.815724_22_plen_308_part_00
MARPYERLQLVYHHVASVDQARMSPAGKAQDKGKRTAGWSSRLCDQEDLTASTYVRTLEPDDIAFFKEHGFLIKKRLLDPVKVAEAMSRVWDVLEGRTLAAVPGISVARHQHSVSPGISRSHPASWVGASVNHDGHHSGGLRSLGHLDWMRELVPYDTNVRAIATAMLGPLRENRRVRGVYPIFPSSSEHLKHGAKPGADPDDHIGQPGISADLLGPHNDGQVCQVSTKSSQPHACLEFIPTYTSLDTEQWLPFEFVRSLMPWHTSRTWLLARVGRRFGLDLTSACITLLSTRATAAPARARWKHAI